MPLPKYLVRLTDDERAQLEDPSRTGTRAASVIAHARILREADAGAGGRCWDDARIAEAVDCGASTVYRVRQAFVEEGLDAALFRKKPTGQQYRKLDGSQEAHWIALVCGTPPTGRSRWTLRLLADRLVELDVVDSISPECVRMTLKKRTQALGAEAVDDSPAGHRAEIELSILSRQVPGSPHPQCRHPDPRGGRLGTGPQRQPPPGDLALHHPRCPHQAQAPLPVNSGRVKH